MLNLGVQSWYALYVKSKTEQAVARGLDQLNIQRFLPTYKSRLGRENHVTWIEKPLYPGYVFCNLSLQRGPKLYLLPGVIKIVSTGRFPSPVSDEEIESIRRLVNSNVSVAPCPYLNEGDMVIVIDGPLKGITGIYVQTEVPGRLVVSLPLLTRSVSVRLECHWVRPLNGKPVYRSSRFHQFNGQIAS